MRARRWQRFLDTFPAIAVMSVLDLGGTVEFWMRSPVRPAQLTLVNLTDETTDADWIDSKTHDACSYQPDRNYDLVVSNSLIEHVGGYRSRRDLATVIRSAAPRYWVQTPYRYFPVEPHWLFPGMQFLPAPARAVVAHKWPLAHTRASGYQEALESALWTELVGKAEFSTLFPDSKILFERVAGIPKSLIAIRP